MIIALGEIIVAVELAPTGSERNVETTATLAGAFLVVAVLWWACFDWLALAMERALAAVTGPVRGSTARDIFTLGHIPLIAGVVLYAVGAEEAVAHAPDHLEPAGRTSLALAIGLIVCAYAFLASRSDHFITWERLVGGAVAITAVLSLQTVNGGTILWIVAFIIGLSLLLEQPRVRAAAHADSR